MVIPGQGEKEMEQHDVFARCLELLKRHHICALATTLEAKPRVRAMEYAVEDSGICYMLTEGGRKIRDILLNPNVSLAVWEDGEGQDSLRGLSVTARAEIVDPGSVDRFSGYYEEYARHMHRDVPIEELLPPAVKLIRVVPDLMELFDPSLKEDGFSPKQIWRR